MALWESELEELMVRRGRALVGYAYSLTRDREQAEDLVQDALVRVFSRLRRPRDTAADGSTRIDLSDQSANSTEGYVRRAILTTYLDGYRRRGRWAGIEHLIADDRVTPGADRAATARVDVGVAMRHLSPRQREVVALRFFEDMTVPNIAETLGTSPGTIKRHLSNAMVVLRASLAEMTAAEMDTDLVRRVDTVSGVVRRRRTVKLAAVGGAVVAAVLLAIAMAWGPVRLMSEPVPPATPSPSGVEASVGGRVPVGWPVDQVPFYCGMEVTALTSSSDTVRLDVTGPVEVAPDSKHLTAPVRVTRTDREGQELTGVVPQLVFAQDGRVVDLGPGWNESEYTIPDVDEPTTDVAEAGAATACGTWTVDGASYDEEYLDQRPRGTYDVYAVLWWMTDEPGIAGYAVSDPVAADVPALEMPSEEPSTVEIRDGYQPPWLHGTSLACGSPASDIPGATYPGWAPELATISTGRDHASVAFTKRVGPALEATRAPVTLVWLSAGRVVALAPDVASGSVEPFHVDERGATTVEVPIGQPDTTCLRNPDAGMPRGRYEVYALMEIDPGSAEDRRFIAMDIARHRLSGADG
ncbi:RNA polymerase sigma factor [Promicromonospora sp. NPDC052451]|uniref:RNA polymerase sigma factor n=1 Tax=Promicromonospora sp. NPDC052451 TaxID=3364407 RepID=UPI0037CA42B3